MKTNYIALTLLSALMLIGSVDTLDARGGGGGHRGGGHGGGHGGGGHHGGGRHGGGHHGGGYHGGGYGGGYWRNGAWIAPAVIGGVAVGAAIGASTSSGGGVSVANAVDSDGLEYWKIQNRTGQDVQIGSDINTLQLVPGADGVLYRGSSFNLMINGQTFRTSDHVVIFYNDAKGNLNIATSSHWRNKVGFEFGIFAGRPDWGYYQGYRGGRHR